jgi:diadenosine tetraphosphate (Ap4A) HIT family hydrolase
MAYLGAAKAPAGCVFCEARSGSDDRTNLVLVRRDHAFLILNLFPYTAGHVMAVVNRHVGTLAEVTPSEMADACPRGAAVERRQQFHIGRGRRARDP